MATISRHKSATSLASTTISELDLVNQFSHKFKGQLAEPFNKILRERCVRQTNTTYSIQEKAAEELQDYALKHLASLCAAPVPQRMTDVDERMSKLCSYLRPTKQEEGEMQKLAEKGKKRDLCLPVERINSRLLKESGVKLDQTILIYVVANVEHISQKILQIAVNYVNQISYHVITAQDIKLLIESFCQDSSSSDLKDERISYIDRFPKAYEDGLKEVMYFEDQFIRQLNIIIRLFREPIERLFPNTPDLNHIFSSVHDILDVTTDLLSSIEDTFEVDEKPQMMGACFCDIMEANGFQHYQQYASDILQPKCRDRLMALLENGLVKEELAKRGREMQSRLRNERGYRSASSANLLHGGSNDPGSPQVMTSMAGGVVGLANDAGSVAVASPIPIHVMPNHHGGHHSLDTVSEASTSVVSAGFASGTPSMASISQRSSTTTLSGHYSGSYTVEPQTNATAEKGERNAMLNASRYLLPRLLLVPIYHFLHYSQILEVMEGFARGDDESNIRSVLSDLSPLRVHIQNLLCGYPALQNEANRMKMFFRTRLASTCDKKIAMKRLDSLQRSVRSEVPWDAVSRECNEFIFEGPLYQRSDRRLTDRYVFLFDGILLLCKHNERRVLTGAQITEYKLKRKVPLYRFEVVDLPYKEVADMDDHYAFTIEFEDSLRGETTSSGELHRDRITLATKTQEEKADWMATLITLQCWPSLEKFLQLQMAEEDRRQPLRLPSEEQYRFALPDSTSNIVFEEQAENSTDVPLVRGGVLLKLVERLTYHTYVDTKFVKTFMMTYRDFTTPLELMDLLIERFHIPDPVIEEGEGDGDGDTDLGVSSMQARLKRFKKEYKKPVQLRVINVLRHWVDHHYSDFQRHPELLDKQEQAFKDVKNRCIYKGVTMIKAIIQRAQSGKHRNFVRQPQDMMAVGMHLVRNYLPDEDYSLMRLNPVELGRQLTLMQFHYYRMIEPSELVGEKWMDRERKHIEAPNVIKTIEFSNKISNWFKFCIVNHDEVNDRVAVMTRICEILYVFEELKNFAGFMEVLGVVDSSAIHRLEWTFANIPKRPLNCQELLDRVRDLMSADHGRKYLEKLRSIDPPCVPFLGTFLTNIDHICVGNSDYLDKDTQRLINFSKRRKIGEIVSEIQQYQNQSYMHLQELPDFQRFLTELDPFKLANVTTEQAFEDFLYDKSLEIEPRDCVRLPNFKQRLTPEEAKPWDVVKELKELSKNPSKLTSNSSKAGGSSTRSMSPPSPRTNSPSIPTIPESEPLPVPSSNSHPVHNPSRGPVSHSASPKQSGNTPPPLPRRSGSSVTQTSSSPPLPATLSPGANLSGTWRPIDDERHLQPKHGYSKSDPVHTMTDGANSGTSTSPSFLSTSPAESAPAMPPSQPPPLPPRRHDSSMSSGGAAPISAGLHEPGAFFASVSGTDSISPPPTPNSPAAGSSMGPPLPPRRREETPSTPKPVVPPRPARLAALMQQRQSAVRETSVNNDETVQQDYPPPPLPPRARR